MRKILPALVVICAALAGVAGGACARPTDAQKQAAQKPAAAKSSTQAAPAAPKVTELKEEGLKSLLGVGAKRERPLLVNFWATWCVPCREEFPDLVKIREQYADERLDFVTVSLDDISDIGGAVPEFLSEQRATRMPAYLLHVADEGTAINFVDSTWQGELPATFLFDRDGQVTFKRKGRVKPAELRAAIEQTLSAKPDAPAQQ
ncbi:MAG TPA: TlpA disulfide reductase family protein [Pyrinomonadaceae bacterium]|nr:TlpA disulfide reductase family protein [Pyrinomonadaceae bacterium]